MCQYVETIKVVNNCALNLAYHNARFIETQAKVFGLVWSEHIEHFLPNVPLQAEPIKVRIVYDCNGVVETSFETYNRRALTSLKLIENNEIDYTYKSTNRLLLNELYAMKQQESDVLIVKNGLITDTSYCNVALFDGHRYLTPAQPLHKGTTLTRLLHEKKLTSCPISPHDLHQFEFLSPFNAMIELGEIKIDINAIHP